MKVDHGPQTPMRISLGWTRHPLAVNSAVRTIELREVERRALKIYLYLAARRDNRTTYTMAS